MAMTMNSPRTPGFPRAVFGCAAAVAVHGFDVMVRRRWRGPERQRRQGGQRRRVGEP
jgi:hypothetical protein